MLRSLRRYADYCSVVGIAFVLLFYVSSQGYAQQPHKLTVAVKDSQENVTALTQVPSQVNAEIGEQLALTVSIDDKDVGTETRPLLRWDINMPAFATIQADKGMPNSNSYVKATEQVFFSAKRDGKYTVTVRLNPKDATHDDGKFTFNVVVAPPSKLVLNPSGGSLPLYAGGPKAKVTVTALDSQGKPYSGAVTLFAKVSAADSVRVTTKEGNSTTANGVDGMVSFASGTELTIESLKKAAGVSVTFWNENNAKTISKTEMLTVDAQNPTVTITGPPENTSLHSGETQTVTAVIKAGDTEITDRKPTFSVTSGGDSLSVDPMTGKVVALSKSGPATVTATDVTGAKASVNFQVIAKGKTLSVTPQSGVVFIGQPTTIHVRILDQNREVVTDADSWTITPTLKSGKATISNTGDTVTLTAQQAGSIVLSLTATGPAGQTLSNEIAFTTPEVIGFRPLKVRMDVVDSGTAKYLFGSQVARDFHVLRVRLFNNLHSNDGVTDGDAILAYCGSIEMRVTLEKRFNRKYHSKVPNVTPDGLWAVAEDSDFISGFTRARSNDDNPFPPGRPRYQWKSGEKIVQGVPQLKPGNELLLTLVDQYGKPIPENMEWDTTNPELAKVDAHGKVTVAASVSNPGIVYITATIPGSRGGKLKLPLAVFANVPANTAVAFVPDDRPMYVNMIRQVRFEPGKEPTGTVTWKSDRPEIADVDVQGRIRAKTPGDTVIRVQYGNNMALAMPILVLSDSASGLAPSVFYDGNELQYLRHAFLYRPYNYEMMVNSLDPRANGSPRNRAFQLMDLLGTSASFLNAVKGLKGNDTPLILDKFSNFLLPNLKRIYPDMRETERQNFVSMAMHPIEEIPFGSDIERILFIPRQPLEGMLRGYDVRISEVDTSYFNVTVAIVKKTSTQSSNNAAAPDQ